MDRPLEVGSRFGVDQNLWNRNWTDLSGGEGQRIMMAIGVALGTAEVLLLDGEFSLPPYPPGFTLFLSPSLSESHLTFFFCLVLITLTILSLMVSAPIPPPYPLRI